MFGERRNEAEIPAKRVEPKQKGEQSASPSSSLPHFAHTCHLQSVSLPGGSQNPGHLVGVVSDSSVSRGHGFTPPFTIRNGSTPRVSAALAPGTRARQGSDAEVVLCRDLRAPRYEAVSLYLRRHVGVSSQFKRESGHPRHLLDSSWERRGRVPLTPSLGWGLSRKLGDREAGPGPDSFGAQTRAQSCVRFRWGSTFL